MYIYVRKIKFLHPEDYQKKKEKEKERERKNNKYKV